MEKPPENPFAEFNAIEWRTYDTFSAFSSFKQFWRETERLVREAADTAQNKDLDRCRLGLDDPADDYHQARRLARHLHDEVITPTFRYAATITLFSVNERELKRFADNLASEHRHELGYRDLRGGLLQQISKYLEAYHKFSLSGVSSYGCIRRLQKVRNCLVHSLGEPSLVPEGERKPLIAMNSQADGLIIEDGIPIEIGDRFVEISLNASVEMFRELFTRVGWKINDRWSTL